MWHSLSHVTLSFSFSCTHYFAKKKKRALLHIVLALGHNTAASLFVFCIDLPTGDLNHSQTRYDGSRDFGVLAHARGDIGLSIWPSRCNLQFGIKCGKRAVAEMSHDTVSYKTVNLMQMIWNFLD